MPEPKPPDEPAGGAGGGQEDHPSAGLSLLRGYQFRLIVDPANEAHFTQCTAPGARVTPVRYREGGESKIVRLFAGQTEFSEVVCRYGMTTSPLLWSWFKKSLDGTPERRNVSLLYLGAGGVGERVRWNLNDAWPCEWRAAPLDALGQEIAIETLVLVYESITRGGAP